MGGAFTAMADDASAVFWNPAGLSRVNRISLLGEFVQREGSDSIISEPTETYNCLSIFSVVYPTKHVNIGLSYSVPIIYYYSYSVSITDVDNNIHNIQGKLNIGLQRYTLSIGKKVTRKINFGINANINKLSITYEMNSMGFELSGDKITYDFGVIFDLSKELSLGLVHKTGARVYYSGKINYDVEHVPEYEAIPAETHFGLAYKQDFFTVEIGREFKNKTEYTDYSPGTKAGTLPARNEIIYKVGLETRFFKGILPLRIGINYNDDLSRYDHLIFTRSIGLGIKLKKFSLDISHQIETSKIYYWDSTKFATRLAFSVFL